MALDNHISDDCLRPHSCVTSSILYYPLPCMRGWYMTNSQRASHRDLTKVLRFLIPCHLVMRRYGFLLSPHSWNRIENKNKVRDRYRISNCPYNKCSNTPRNVGRHFTKGETHSVAGAERGLWLNKIKIGVIQDGHVSTSHSSRRFSQRSPN